LQSDAQAMRLAADTLRSILARRVSAQPPKEWLYAETDFAEGTRQYKLGNYGTSFLSYQKAMKKYQDLQFDMMGAQSPGHQQTEPAESKVSPPALSPLSNAAKSLNLELREAQMISDHRIRDVAVLKIACQALQQGVSSVAESAADSLSAAKDAQRVTIKSAAQSITSPHRPTPNWQAFCL
jgi:hypothetical protein